MSVRPRVHEIASEAGVDSKIALVVLKEMGEYVKGPSSALDPPVARRLAARLTTMGGRLPTHEPAGGTSRVAALALQTQQHSTSFRQPRNPTKRPGISLNMPDRDANVDVNGERLSRPARAKGRSRNRHAAIVRPDIRSLRLGLGLSLKDAAVHLREPESLLIQQEEAGSNADITFRSETTDRYLDRAAAMLRGGELPPMIDERGRTTIYWLRQGLGLTHQSAAIIAETQVQAIERLEISNDRLPHDLLGSTWRSYADWAIRRNLRAKRQARAGQGDQATPMRKGLANLQYDREQDALLRSAYRPLVTAAEAEAAVRRFIYGDDL